MAALDFPNNPINGQSWNAPSGNVYTWDGAVWKTTGSNMGSTTAGGDLTGTYPNPLVGPLAVGNAEISDVAWSKVTGAPAGFPPLGTAGGDLTGTYPNPTVGPLKITDAKVNDVAWGKITGKPTSMP